MATSDIPTLPGGDSSPVPSAAPSSVNSLPALPSLPSLTDTLGLSNSQWTDSLTALKNAANANGVSTSQQQQINANAPQNQDGFFVKLTAWLKSIAVPGTLAIAGLLIIVLSIYMAVTSAKKHWG